MKKLLRFSPVCLRSGWNANKNYRFETTNRIDQNRRKPVHLIEHRLNKWIEQHQLINYRRCSTLKWVEKILIVADYQFFMVSIVFLNLFQCSSLSFFFFFFFYRLWFCSTFLFHLLCYFSVTISSYSYFGWFGRYVFFLDTVWSDFMNFDTQSHIIDESFNLNRTKNDNYYYSPWKLSTNNHFKLI